jgi:hypothetical protein
LSFHEAKVDDSFLVLDGNPRLALGTFKKEQMFLRQPRWTIKIAL